MTDADLNNQKIAFDYAWGWFSLHAGQRMKAVNYFLIATAFLAASYVSAIGGNRPSLAVVISALGAFFSFIFYRVERRVRGLIKAAEAALLPIEERMAASSGIEELRIVKQVERAPKGAWSYHEVFRALYAGVGSAFTMGVVYASSARLTVMTQNVNLSCLPRLLSGAGLLLFSYAILRLGILHNPKDREVGTDAAQKVVQIVLAISAAVAAGVILIHLSLFS
jgi:hypothetical protein